MKFSKETIEIDGIEYTLFLNRQGIVSWERFSKEDQNIISSTSDKLEEVEKNLLTESISYKEDINPFEEEKSKQLLEVLEESVNAKSKLYEKLYWIMLYTEHKLNFEQAKQLYDKACKEYGAEQVNALADQMMNDANINKIEEKEIKKLPALRPQN